MTEFVLAIAFATIILTSIASLKYLQDQKISQNTEIGRMQSAAYAISDIFIKTPGIPPDWESNITNISAIGLAINDRILDKSKVDTFTNLDYNLTKQKLKLSYDYVFSIEHTNGTIIAESGTFPKKELVANSKRLVTYEGKPVILTIKLSR